MNRFLPILIYLWAAALSRAQPALPPPHVAFPAGNAAWTIVITYRGNQSPKPPESIADAKRQRIEVTRTGNISLYRTTWNTGKKTEDWVTAKYIIFQDPLSGATRCGPNDSMVLTYPLNDQTNFAWVSSGQSMGEVSFQGTSCILVKSENSLQAWIDAKTHLPVALDDGSALYAYSFQPPPTTQLVLPKEYQDYLARYEKALAAPPVLGNPRPPPP